MSDLSPIPAPKPTDHEDVSWALSTAEANWKRGDQADALKWLQRAAEAASEAGLDSRYLELAKAASSLASRIESSPRMPQPTTEDPHPSGATIVQPMGVVLPDSPARPKTSKPPPIPRDRPSAPAPRRDSGVPPARPSSPAPQRASATPPRSGSKVPAAPRVPPPAPSRPAVAASTGERPSVIPRASTSAPKIEDSKPQLEMPRAAPQEQLRTVRNLDKMAHLAALTRSDSPPPAPRPPRARLDPEDQTQVMPSSAAPKTEVAPEVKTGHDSDQTLLGAPQTPMVTPSAHEVEPEPWPTQASSRSGGAGSRRPAADVRDATLVPDPSEPRPTQALRVLLYRTADGVRIAAPGTKVQAMCIEAMVVALDPAADLASWLK